MESVRECGFWRENAKRGFELFDLAQFMFGAIPLVFSLQMSPFCASPPFPRPPLSSVWACCLLAVSPFLSQNSRVSFPG